MDRNKPLFNLGEQLNVVSDNFTLLDRLKFATTVKEWNSIRESIRIESKSSERDKLILFGYIDGLLHKWII